MRLKKGNLKLKKKRLLNPEFKSIFWYQRWESKNVTFSNNYISLMVIDGHHRWARLHFI